MPVMIQLLMVGDAPSHRMPPPPAPQPVILPPVIVNPESDGVVLLVGLKYKAPAIAAPADDTVFRPVFRPNRNGLALKIDSIGTKKNAGAVGHQNRIAIVGCIDGSLDSAIVAGNGDGIQRVVH